LTEDVDFRGEAAPQIGPYVQSEVWWLSRRPGLYGEPALSVRGSQSSN